MNDKQSQRVVALFYCQNTPRSGEQERQSLEETYGPTLRLFPIPCSGRLEPLHLLKSLEEFADMACVIACPNGTCRYLEGNRRAQKRVERTRSIIESIGLEKERLEIIIRSADNGKGLSDYTQEVVTNAANLSPSPVHSRIKGS